MMGKLEFGVKMVCYGSYLNVLGKKDVAIEFPV